MCWAVVQHLQFGVTWIEVPAHYNGCWMGFSDRRPLKGPGVFLL